MFEQILNPAGKLWATELFALVPLFCLLLMLAAFRMTAWLATLLGGIATLVIGVLVWHAPLAGTMKSYLFGGLTGMWNVDWIALWGMIFFNTIVLTGRFDQFKNWVLYHATADVRIQTIMLAWAFGALLEGLVGFGYPWAVVVPILVGLGIEDLEAIRVAALANNAPVAFGALGVPIITLSAVTGLPLMALSASVGDIVAVLALLPPWVLIYLVSGWEGLMEAWPLAIVGSLSYIAGQWPVARYLGPYLPDLGGALVSFGVLFLFVKVWRPKNIRGFGGVVLQQGSAPHVDPSLVPSGRGVFLACLPFLVLIAVIVAWTGPWSHLTGISLLKLSVASLSSVTQKPALSTFNFTPLGGGSAVLASWLVLLAILRPSVKILRQVFSRTFHQMWGAVLVGFFVFGIAYVFVYTGMANSLAYGLAKFGRFYIVLAPILGWIGVALSGSNTSTNAMFGPLQAATGRILNLPPLLLPSFNSIGAEVGKPIAPQTASVGVSTSKLVRSEGAVIRHNMGWTLVMLGYVILLTLLFYYEFPSLMQVK